MPSRTLAVLGLSLAALACAPEPPSLLLVTLDTTRADRIGAYGRAGAHTPTLDALAREGVLFEQAWAPTPITLPSHASLLTGVSPPRHGVRDNGDYVLGPEARLLAEALAERGWRTGAFVGAYVLDARFGLDQGFEVYSGPPARGGELEVERPAGRVVEDAAAWLESLPSGERFFAWVHLFDPHRPYVAPPLYGDSDLHPYEREIAYADAELGALLGRIAGAGHGNVLVAVTADHGESLHEHGEATHGIFLYAATLRVPLILSGPALSGAAGTRVAQPVAAQALAATLLELLELPRDLLPEARDRALLAPGGVPAADRGEAPITLESLLPYRAFRWRALRGLIWRGHQLVQGVAPELYDLAADPDQLDDRARREPERARQLAARLDQQLAEERPLGWGGLRERPDADVERLRALGYLEASLHAGDPFAADLPDPRRRIGDVELVSRARDQQERARRADRLERWRTRLERARALYERVQAANPADPHVARGLGSVLSDLGEHERALPLLEEALVHYPKGADLHHRLERTHRALGHEEQARAHGEIARGLDPEGLSRPAEPPAPREP